MRWRRRYRETDTGGASAFRDASQQYEEVQKRGAEVSELGDTIREILVRNHLSEKVRRALQERPA